MPGAVFGEVGAWLFLASAAFRVILEDSRSAKCCIFSYNVRPKMGRVRCGCEMMTLSSDYCRICSNRLLAEALQGFSLKSWTRNFLAGAVLGEFEGWLNLLRVLEMAFHMWRGSLMTFILHGRRSVWWRCKVTRVAPPIVNDVSHECVKNQPWELLCSTWSSTLQYRSSTGVVLCSTE